MHKLLTKNVSVWFGTTCVLNDVSIGIPRNTVTALLGASGSGKSTFLRLFNRMNDYEPNHKTIGEVYIDGTNIQSPDTNVYELRRKVGFIFNTPEPFPRSIRDNLAFPLKIKGVSNKNLIDEQIEKVLHLVGLWDEVKDKHHLNALSLPIGAQQRLCIARALVLEPSVLLLDDPSTGLDPISAAKIEWLINELKKNITILLVTHNLQLASRLSDNTAFFKSGQLIEFGATRKVFTNPTDPQTQDYITGRYH